MEPLVIREGLAIPGEYLSVSYVRDLGAEGTAEAARRTPTSVELRLAVGRCDVLAPDARERILGHPRLRHDRRGTVRVIVGVHQSRGANLREARARLAQAVREAIDDAPASHPPEPEVRRRRGGRAGLIKQGPDGD